MIFTIMRKELFADETEALRCDDLTAVQRNSWQLDNELYKAIIRDIARQKIDGDKEKES